MTVGTVAGNHSTFCIDYPEAIEASTGLAGLVLPRRDFFLILARDVEGGDPKRAAFYREVAAHFPECDRGGYDVNRSGTGAILAEFDDWDDLTDEQRLARGNRNAAIASLERVRLQLEMMDDAPDALAFIDEMRRNFNELAEELNWH